MLILAIIFALLASLLNASSAVMQRHATGQVPPNHLFRTRILREVITRKLWLGGVGLQVLAFLALAAALANGPLVLVVPLSTVSLIFMIALLKFVLHIPIGRREWIGVAAISGGVSGLLAVANPRSGQVIAGFWGWIILAGAVAALVIFGAILMRSVKSANVRGAIGGFVAGLHFAFTNAVTKLVVGQLHLGIQHAFVSWPLYLLIIVGASSAYSMQSMYGAGPLAFSQPTAEIAEDLSGVAFGLIMFHEMVNTDALSLAVESVCALVLVIGITLLASSQRLREESHL